MFAQLCLLTTHFGLTMMRPGERTPRSGLLLLLAWAFSSAVSKEVQLDAATEVEARCGENLKLTCNTSTEVSDMKLFTWSAKGRVSCDRENKTDVCQMRSGDGLQTLSMTITNISTSDFGKYLCKLHTRFDTLSRVTQLTVTDCAVKNRSHINATFAVCQFSDVKMHPEVHWFVDGKNLTGSASEHLTRQDSGFFDITSSIMQTRLRRRHKCMLWSVPEGRYLEGQTMILGSSSTAHWAWLPLTLALLMLQV
ncbi:uncharacterized protein ACB058_020540 [Synchiropus picturatus]